MISTPGFQKAPAADSAAPVDPAAPADPAVSTDPADPAAAGTPVRRRRRIGVLLSVALLAYLLDLGSKLLVVARLEYHEPIRIAGDWVMLQAIRNPGAAFGMGAAMTIVFTVIATTVVVVICRLARKLYSLPWAIALGLLLGGAFGNLTDRIFRSPSTFRGAVVDFISVKHFAVFNLADSAIVCGGVLVVLLSFLGTNPDGTTMREHGGGDGTADGTTDSGNADRTVEQQPAEDGTGKA
ncbi:signal peptidase II [Streptacidiphilus sp. N1-10]|uniref:Lipoprotein signal peptidase n=1 Tax=Streptacidiphilus jeojiensis TaxID=3229225 RepID=A0ABV6Y0W7_9ACTN